MRLLLAEDDDVMGSAMRTALMRAGFAVDWVHLGREFQSAVTCHQYDLAVIDLGLPDVGGELLLRSIRATHPRLPVIMVTARQRVNEMMALMDEGANDYLIKPFDMRELSARITMVMRRTARDSETVDAFSYGPLTLHPQRCSASWRGQLVPLTRREYRVLEVLMRRKNQVLSRAQIEEALYGWDVDVESNAIEVYIHFLRRKFHQDLIHTVRGVGYQLAPLNRLGLG